MSMTAFATTQDEFRGTGVVGILYAEDFGEDPAPPDSGPEMEAAPPPITQADVDAACRNAVAAAEADWARGVAERRTVALQYMAAGMDALRREAASHAEAAADALVRAALAAVTGALPHLCRAHGPAEVAALVRDVLPSLAARGRVVVRAHAATLPLLEDDLRALPDGVSDTVELRGANIAPGDVRLSWESGDLVRDSQALCTAMMDGLARLGLLVPTPASERTLTHAQPA